MADRLIRKTGAGLYGTVSIEAKVVKKLRKDKTGRWIWKLSLRHYKSQDKLMEQVFNT